MSFNNIINVILPPIQYEGSGYVARISSPWGNPRGTGQHGGVDINYNYPGGQAGINLKHPAVHAPIDGKVVITVRLQ